MISTKDLADHFGILGGAHAARGIAKIDRLLASIPANAKDSANGNVIKGRLVTVGELKAACAALRAELTVQS